MGLIVPAPPSWAHCTHNLPATPSGTTFGTQLTTGITNNKGAVTALLGAALTHDVEFLLIGLHSFRLSGSDGAALLDIMIDKAGGTSWEVLIPNLLAGWSNSANLNNGDGSARTYYFPIWIPAGATIGARAQTSLGSSLTGFITIYALGGNKNPASWWAGQTVEAIAADAGTSRGQFHTSGNSGAFSSWANLGSVLTRDCGAVQWAAQGENDTDAASTIVHHFEFGVSGVRIGPPLVTGMSFTESGAWLPTIPIFHSLPAGAQLQVRGTCSGTAQTIDVAAYAVS